MFSGIISHDGWVLFRQKNRLVIDAPLKKISLGDSIAVNGICLTVTGVRPYKRKSFTIGFAISTETNDVTTIGKWKEGRRVNVEPALKMSDALGGHIVQGHVDGVARLEKISGNEIDSSQIYSFGASKEILKGLVMKGSVTVDGVSLTVAKLSSTSFSVALIPYTLTHTTLGKLKTGATVNIEVDIMGKYIRKYLKK